MPHARCRRRRVTQGFEARGNIDAIAEYVVAVDDDIADIDADTEDDLLVVRDVRVAPQQLALDLNGKRDRIDDACEFDQHAVAGGLDDAFPVFRNSGIDQLPTVRFQGRKSADLVGSHQTTVADHVYRRT